MKRLAVSTCWFVAGMLALWSAPIKAQPADTGSSAVGTYYYRNGVKHALRIDLTRHVVLGSSPSIEPVVVRTDRSNKSLVNSTPLYLDLASNTERALPGGIVVTFASSVSQEQALALLDAQGLASRRPLIGSTVWLVDSPSGNAALLLANRLQETGKFLAVEPNWWRQRSSK